MKSSQQFTGVGAPEIAVNSKQPYLKEGVTNDKSKNSNLKDSKKLKQIFPFEDKHLVVIDKSIIQKLGINDNITIFVEQEITQDNAILMKIRKI